MSLFNRDHKDSPLYMPERYDYASWDFLTGCDQSKSHHETMSRADQSVRFNDEEYYTGGLCPSCRLAVNKESGRLKWCMGGNDSWRARIRLMLLIPALLLPITIVFIAISRSTVVGTISHPKPQILDSTRLNIVAEESFSPTVRGDLEESESEDRELLREVKTSFVHVDEFPALPPPRSRRKRDASKKWNVYPGNVTRDLIIWNFPANDSIYREFEFQENLLPNVLMKMRKRTNEIARSLQASRIGRDDPRELQILPGEEDQGAERETDKPMANLEEPLVNYSVEEAEAYDSGEIDQNDYSQDGEQSYSKSEESGNSRLPWRLSDTLDKDEQGEEQSQSEVDDTEQSRPSIDDETWLAVDDKVSDITSDFHAFWKGEGNLKSIREAQAKVMLKYMDHSADPCQDFYQYACGNWAKRNPIPKDKAGYDTFEMLRESLDFVLKELLEEPILQSAKANPDDATVKAKHLFKSCMNYEVLEQRMEKPLIELLEELGGWPILQPNWNSEKFDWLLLAAQLRLYNNDILISEWVGPDIKNSDQYVIQFDQTSLGLPTRDYFLQPSNFIYLEAYKNYLIKIATLLGAPLENATIHADELIEFETKLAKITSSPNERRNVSELYQRMTIGELRTVVPQIDWHRYLTIVLARPANISEPVVVFALQYIQDLVNLLSRTPPRIIANYLLWRFVRHRVNNLDDRFQEAKQKFYFILFGREQAPSRWKNCIAQVNSNMGMAVGSMFVRKYFDENSKNDTLSMTQEIQQSFLELLNKTCWIDDETKRLAGEKVDAMLLRIGYPDFIRQPHLLDERYKDVIIRPDKYFENTLNILQHLTRVEQDRLGSPVNKTLWNTAPAVVNAYYSRNKNQIMFPAGILQPPFYHRFFPRSLNYGGIGVVIGHEITHGFDDKGRLFDKDGNLHRWWKDEAITGFHQRAQCLIDQYSRYIVNEVGMQIDGVNTQGENIADNGGIKQAFRAYEKWLSANGDANETLPGISANGKQLFFLNFAQVWCGSMRPEATRNKLKTAVHSPGKFRVIGTLSNSKDFAQVFDCPIGSPMNPARKCLVW